MVDLQEWPMKYAVVSCFAMAVVPGLAWSAPSCDARSGVRTAALVELYTSEGCSSCPPADRWFGQLAAGANPQELSLLAFHVDYWDAIGWPDRFAQHAFTVRQSQRVRASGSSTVFTPQVMLSSQLRLGWNQPAKVSSEIAAMGRKPAAVDLAMRAQRESAQWRVSIDARPISGARTKGRLYLAMYENALVSSIKAGENEGVTLRHERVVRGLWGPWPLPASGAPRRLMLVAPPHARPEQLGLTAFVQVPATGETIQALSLPLAGCAH